MTQLKSDRELTEQKGDNREVVTLSPLFAKDLVMHPLFTQASGITHDVIGAAIAVHKDKGLGLLESSPTRTSTESTDALLCYLCSLLFKSARWSESHEVSRK